MLRISASLSSDQVTSFYEAIQIYERNQFSAYKPDQKDINKFRYLLKKCAYTLKNKGKNLS
jgi:protein-glutamine gamma-glutamyltransferase